MRTLLPLPLLLALLAAPQVVGADPAPARKLADFRRVVVADTPSPIEKVAAAELTGYVEKLTGTAVPVVPVGKYDPAAAGHSFFVGGAVAAKALGADPGPWKPEEYVIRSVPAGLVLAGDDGPGDPWSAHTRAGTLLAVYTLLDDHLGVRWLWPGPFGEHVPRTPDATIPALNVRSVPKLMIRSVQLGYTSYHTAAFKDDAQKWARRARLAWTRSAVFGHSWYDAFRLKTGEDFKAHPEWFALVNGKRQPPQMCTTNPAVVDRMVEFALAGKSDIMHISPSDGGGFCQCETCRALDVPGLLAYDNTTPQLSDRIFTYANEVARRVRAKDPDRGVGMFAYTFYNRPPQRIGKLEPNLYLSFVYQAASHRNPKALAEWRESVAGWKKLGAQMVMREGWGNHYALDLPYLHPRQIGANFAEAYRLGFRAAYGEGTKSFATQAPNHWMIARMAWDPERDPAATLDDFYRTAYGPVAAEMRAFFEAYETALDDNWGKQRRLVDTEVIAYANLTSSWHRLLPRTVVDAAEAHLRAAEKKAPAGEYADRVRFHRSGQDYTATLLELLEAYRRLGKLGVKLDVFAAVAEKKETNDAERDRLLKRAFDLGERREDLLLAHRDWAAMDEGMYAFTVDRGLRRWHAQVKTALGIDKPSRVSKGALAK